MGGGAEGDDGFAGVEVVGEGLQLLIGEVAEAGANDDEVGFGDGFHAADVFLVVDIDEIAVGVEGEENRGFEAEAFAEDFGKHGTGFLGAIFFVAGDEDDMLVFAGEIGVAMEAERLSPVGRQEGGGGQKEKEDEVLLH